MPSVQRLRSGKKSHCTEVFENKNSEELNSDDIRINVIQNPSKKILINHYPILTPSVVVRYFENYSLKFIPAERHTRHLSQNHC